ncbi:MAG: hypothetical protein HYU33_01270 [Candidatus Omnitrophica bacterium]|nr:hypothetical protein [Candidatus Omnitrophota bacterium]MBI3009791.1 hypothetical protein [Candidatus Omnitrophota bacterium]
MIPLTGGIYSYLLYFGIIRMKDHEAWKQRFGGLVKVAAPICIALGLFMLLGFVGS